MDKNEIQFLLDTEAQLGNTRLEIQERIIMLRGKNPPHCWGEDDCSTTMLVQCPWRIDCGDKK